MFLGRPLVAEKATDAPSEVEMRMVEEEMGLLRGKHMLKWHRPC